MGTRGIIGRSARRLERAGELPGTLRLLAAETSGRREVGPYYIYGTSENGRYVVARDVKTGTWW